MLGTTEEEQKSTSVISSSNKDTFISTSTNGNINAPTKSLNLISNTLKNHLANGLPNLTSSELITQSNNGGNMGAAKNMMTLKNIISKQMKTTQNQNANSISMPMTPHSNVTPSPSHSNA